MQEQFGKEIETMKKVKMLEMKTSTNQIETKVDGIIGRSRRKNIRDGVLDQGDITHKKILKK
jgi:hypothetical protein